jgi:hypothetical protein
LLLVANTYEGTLKLLICRAERKQRVVSWHRMYQ